MRYSLLIILLFAIGCENPVSISKPENVRLKATYSISVIDHANVVFGIAINLESRTDIDTVQVQVWQSRQNTENGSYRLPYSTSLLVKNTQATIDSLVVIGNPKP